MNIFEISIILAALVTLSESANQRCGPLQILKVKNQWEKAYGVGRTRDDVGISVWRSIFRLDPTVRPLLARVHSEDLYHPEFTAHSARVFGGLDALIALLDQPDTYTMQVQHLNVIHKVNKLANNHLWLMKDALMKIIPATIGRCFDKVAWDACLDHILWGMST